MRFCSRCHAYKSLAEFYPRKDTASGFVSHCRDCQRASYERRREKILQNKRDYYLRNIDSIKVEHKKWHLKNKESNAKRMLEWQRRNRARCRSYFVEYMAKKKCATPKWANRFFIQEIYDLARRRTKATGIVWNVDHIVPLVSPKVCGLHVERNLRVIPESQNKSKGNFHWPDMP